MSPALFVREDKSRDTFQLTSITDLPACFVSAKADIIDAITFALGGNVVNLVKVEDEALGQLFAGQLSCDERVESYLEYNRKKSWNPMFGLPLYPDARDMSQELKTEV